MMTLTRASRKSVLLRVLACAASSSVVSTCSAFHTSCAGRTATSLVPSVSPRAHAIVNQQLASLHPSSLVSAKKQYQLSRRHMSSGGDDGAPAPPINRIQKPTFSQIVDEYESLGREESGYVVIDVRGDDEIAFTGKVSENTETLPLPLIQEGAFMLDEEDFEERFGFAKPALDETLVFTCKAGVRSNYAAQFAAMAGYSKLFDYIGGANEWFY